MTIITQEQEATSYLDAFDNPSPPTELFINRDSKKQDEELIQTNDSIIKNANKILVERLENSDGSLQVKDIVQIKSDAFKQNQSLLGRGDSTIDPRKLIPAVINIQINH